MEVGNIGDWAWELKETGWKLVPSNPEAIAGVEHTAGDAEVASFANLEHSMVAGIDKHCSRVPGMKVGL